MTLQTRLTEALILLTLGVPASAGTSDGAIITETQDGVTIHGETHFAGLKDDAPLVLLFHQARANGRGEYASIAPWLNTLGFRAITWDSRAGGDLFEASNKTVAGLSEGTPTGYCDAYPDLKAALDHVLGSKLADKVVVWGSSYSAALVFRLAAENPEHVTAVVSCSPASGGPMEACRGREWADQIEARVLVLRPQSEMARESSVEQKAVFEQAGFDFMTVEHGVHGSSMLVDERTDHDMSDARAKVKAWLIQVFEEELD